MTLSEFSAAKRREILDVLERGLDPNEGSFSAAILKEVRVRKMSPQLGSLHYTPDALVLEYIFSAPREQSIVFTVTLDAPFRIVYLPVPSWVVQSIWQGEIAGSYHFESEAEALVATFAQGLSPLENAVHFGEDASTGKGRS